MQVRSTGEPELLQAQRRRREQREADRTITTEPRRARRRRQSAPWLQRNALNAAAISVLIAFLGLGFGLLQMLNGADGSGPLYLAPSDLAPSDVPTSTDNPDILQAAVASPRVRVGASGSGTDSASQGQAAIHFSAKGDRAELHRGGGRYAAEDRRSIQHERRPNRGVQQSV